MLRTHVTLNSPVPLPKIETHPKSEAGKTEERITDKMIKKMVAARAVGGKTPVCRRGYFAGLLRINHPTAMYQTGRASATTTAVINTAWILK